jgi:hypothetical protein
MAFGEQFPGTASSTQTIHIVNVGNKPLTISNIALAGAGYAIQPTGTLDCSNGIVLAPSTYCQVAANVTPTHAGNWNGTITFTSNSLNNATTAQVANLTAFVYGAYVTASPSPLAFPSQAINTTSTAQTVTFTNQGLLYNAGISAPTSDNTVFTPTLGTCTTGLAPGATCQISVTFTPTAAQSYTGNITSSISSSGGGPNTTATFAVTGTGTAPAAPQAVLTPTTFTFPSTNIGSTMTEAFTLSNPGTAPLTGIVTTLSGANTADYSISNNCSGTLAAGSTCSVTLNFIPQATGTFTATVNVADNATGSSQTATVTGTGTPAPAPAVTLSPTSLTFPSTQVGSTATAQTIMVTNSGNAHLTLSSINVTGANAADFTESGTTCSTTGGTIAAGASCMINVTFTPASAGSFIGGITIGDNATGSPQTVPVSGTGTPAPAPQAVLTPSSLSFPSTTVGATSAAQTLTLSNSGNASLSISSITVTGTNTADFAKTTTCSALLAAGSTCTISVTFTPASAASFTAAITVTDNATGSPQTTSLSGTGTPAPTPQAVLTPSTLSFPNTTVGTTSAAQTLTLSNPGTATLSISGVTVTSANTSDFAETSNCSTSLAANATCTINVTFTPASAASFSASVSVADNASGSPQAVTLSGTGAAPAAPDFTTTSPTAPQTVTRGGAAQYTIAVQPSNGSFTNAATLSATGMPPGATASFQPASVTPGSAGATSTMTIQTAATMARSTQPKHWPILPPGITLALVVPLFWRRLRNKSQRARPQPLLGALVFALLGAGAAFMTGCGAGFALPSTSTTYTITVTGASGSNTHSTTVSLILK